jgi:hypothetical protein
MRSTTRSIAELFATAVLLTIFAAAVSLADIWSFDPVVDEEVFEFGHVSIVRTMDARRNRRYPDYSISIFRKDELRALYRGVSFEHIAASRNNDFFVGVSNKGLPGTAVVIFDQDGNLRTEIKHIPIFEYCKKSSTIHRVWYDENDPDIRFEYYEKRGLGNRIGSIKTVSLVDCKGERRDLIELLDQAMGIAE